jgi:hypothetical protein
MTDRSLMRKGDQLPAWTLDATGGEPAIPLRADDRRATVLVTVHAECTECATYLDELEGHADEMRAWDGRVVAVTAGDSAAVPGGDRGFVKLARDVASRLEQRGVPRTGMVIADQWGEIFAVEAADDNHSFPAVAEVVGWLRFLAIQCPECQGEAL